MASVSQVNSREIRYAGAVSLWTTVCLVVGVLLLRRMIGGFDPLATSTPGCIASTLTMLLTILTLAMFRAKIRQINQEQRGSVARRIAYTSELVTIIPPLLLGAILAPASGLFTPFYLLGLFAVGCYAASRISPTGFMRMLQRYVVIPTIKVFRGTHHEMPTIGLSDAEVVGIYRDEEEHLPAAPDSERLDNQQTVSQEWRRSSNRQGQEEISGRFRGEFLEGQTLVPLHLPIWPPLATTPKIECLPENRANIRVRVVTAQPYGVRLELKRGRGKLQAESIDFSFQIGEVASSSRVA